MKKVGYLVVGVLAGAMLSFSVSAYGEQLGLVGKKVQGESAVVVGGNKIGSAVIIDGKSYAPVREIGEAAGYEVSYKKGEISLSDADAVESETIFLPNLKTYPDRTVSVEERLRSINNELAITKAELDMTKDVLAESPNADQEYKDTLNAGIVRLESEIAGLEAQKAALEAQE